MKKVLTFVTCVFTTILLIISCSKDKEHPTPVQPPIPVIPPPVAVNQPPVARAGADTTFTLSSCGAIIRVTLDGSNSSDPENKITGASWRIISGPRDVSLLPSPNSLNAIAEFRRAGVYNFELQIVDNGNLTSKDTITITLIGSSPKEYDLDISSNTNYIFRDNYEDCNEGPLADKCPYYDETEIHGTGFFAPIGSLNIDLKEFSDTANSSYAKESFFSIYNYNYSINIYGSTAINFKKLIQQGGGLFNGNFSVKGGSAIICDAHIYNSIAPLLVTGTLDTATKKVSIMIKGKTFF